jgi:hypothetical protein
MSEKEPEELTQDDLCKHYKENIKLITKQWNEIINHDLITKTTSDGRKISAADRHYLANKHKFDMMNRLEEEKEYFKREGSDVEKCL